MCGANSLDTEREFEICEYCSWEDDPVQFDELGFSGGANSQSLNEAKKLYNFINKNDQG